MRTNGRPTTDRPATDRQSGSIWESLIRIEELNSDLNKLCLKVGSHYERLFQRWPAFEKSNK